MTNGRSANSLYVAQRQRSSNVGHDVYIINILIDDGTPNTGQIITYKMYIIVKRRCYEYTVNTLLYFILIRRLSCFL